MDFFNVLTGPELLEQTEAHLPEHRERLYPPTVTLAMFMRQALNEDRSCQKTVNGWAAQRVSEGLRANGVDTGAYCRARQRLPHPAAPVTRILRSGLRKRQLSMPIGVWLKRGASA